MPLAAMKANATIGPTPGTLISRQHTGERRALLELPVEPRNLALDRRQPL